MPVRGPLGQTVYLSGHSPLRLQVVSALANFLEITGRGFFALVTYVAVLGLRERRRVHAGRNAPCPCGSGRKFKRCCGRVN
jgi:SEC-C motif-containing protein